jgi:hypothetical protein
MHVSHPSTAPDYYGSGVGGYNAGPLRSGSLETKVLAVGKEGELNCFRMSIEASGGEAKEQWTTPRHRHNLDQIRLQVEGEWSLTEDIMMLPGMVYYFPESVHYGPQLGKHGSTTLNIQFGGASRNGYIHPHVRARGYHELVQKGYFEKGAYTWIDDKGQRHRKDAYEAIWEHIQGRKIEYAPPRYDCVVQMNPANYYWIKDPAQPGLARKSLGSFTENNMQVGFVRIDPGATLIVGLHTAPELLFIVKGAVLHGGQTYGLHTAFSLEPSEGPTAIEGVDYAELYNVRLPTFAAASELTDFPSSPSRFGRR